jgi:hypothetical protein
VKNGFIVQDEAGHTLRLTFKNAKFYSQEISVQLESLQYNSGPTIIPPPTTLRFQWTSTSEKKVKDLEQRVEVRNKFLVTAKYTARTDKTKIDIKIGNQTPTSQTLPGLVIIRLLTQSGSLDFEF